jgi:hypothetical protein
MMFFSWQSLYINEVEQTQTGYSKKRMLVLGGRPGPKQQAKYLIESISHFLCMLCAPCSNYK